MYPQPASNYAHRTSTRHSRLIDLYLPGLYVKCVAQLAVGRYTLSCMWLAATLDRERRDGGARAHFYYPSRGEWIQWVNMLPELQIPEGATMGDIVVPNAYTAQYNSLLTLLLNRDKKVGGDLPIPFSAAMYWVTHNINVQSFSRPIIQEICVWRTQYSIGAIAQVSI